MIKLIVLLVKLMVAGSKLDIMFSGWDGWLEHLRGLFGLLNPGE